MAVQKSRRTRRTRGNRRSHDAIKNGPSLAIDSTTGEMHLSHHMTPGGYYRGRQILVPKKGKEENGSAQNDMAAIA